MAPSRLLVLFSFSVFLASSQNDIDAIRYSRNGVGGTSRFIGMGGAFGAVGADISCSAYNPAGLGIFRKGEIAYGGSVRLSNNTGQIYNTRTSVADIKFVFNNFGLAVAFPSNIDPESRQVLSFTNIQLQNFNSSTSMQGYTNNSSIATDMKILADKAGAIDNLNSSYEGLGYQTYLLDDNGNIFNSLVDPKKTVLQTRDIVTSGRSNELNFSYAYSHKDKYYFGVSIGAPRVEYVSTKTHTEVDNRDSMNITFDSPNTYTTNYVDGLPNLHTTYIDRLGFNSLVYTEYFKTKGSGINLKLGGIVRLNDMLRLGLYYHTPTIYYLNDTYYNTMLTSFDKKPNSPDTYKNPPDGGFYEYRLVTPARLSANVAIVLKKIAVIAADYEVLNYSKAELLSSTASVFAGVNSVIKSKYSFAQNLRVGAEINIKPVMLRAGYTMAGSPFGDTFTGDFVRHTVNLGIGFRTSRKWYFDFFWNKSFTTENYFLFSVLNTKAKLNLSAASLGLTVGIKF